MSDHKRDKKIAWGTWGVIALALFLVACSSETEVAIPSEPGQYAVLKGTSTLELYRVLEDGTIYTDSGTKRGGQYQFQLCGDAGTGRGLSGRGTIGVVFQNGALPGCPLRVSEEYQIVITR